MRIPSTHPGQPNIFTPQLVSVDTLAYCMHLLFAMYADFTLARKVRHVNVRHPKNHP
jgi:hypothetical protein